MSKIVRMLLCLFCLVGGSAFAADDEPLYAGCVDARGAAVVSLLDPGLPTVAATSTEAGRPVIRHNPAVLPRLSQRARSFFYAQSCARLNLGYPADGDLPLEAAQRADCVALDTLQRSGLLGAASLPALEAELQFSEPEWAGVSGPVRQIALQSCPRSRGSLSLPGAGAAGSSAWNACVRACAAPLYQCQARCAAGACGDCQTAYDRCNRACDGR